MMTTLTSRRRAALRAASAVTLGALSTTSCAGNRATDASAPTSAEPAPTEPETVAQSERTLVPLPPPEAPEPREVQLPAATQVQLDAGTHAACSPTSDGVCPEGCTIETDFDCCEAPSTGGMWCNYDPKWGCMCAVEGPFSAPRFAARSHARR